MREEYTDGFFNVSRKFGFLPMKTTFKDIPNSYQPLVDLCNELPTIKKDNRLGILHYPNLICEKIKDIPNWFVDQTGKIQPTCKIRF